MKFLRVICMLLFQPRSSQWLQNTCWIFLIPPPSRSPFLVNKRSISCGAAPYVARAGVSQRASSNLGGIGLEPMAPTMSKWCATNCANRPYRALILTRPHHLAKKTAADCKKIKAAPRFELGDKGFADLCLTTWLCRQTRRPGANALAPALALIKVYPIVL
jgi:hypothetical protein